MYQVIQTASYIGDPNIPIQAMTHAVVQQIDGVWGILCMAPSEKQASIIAGSMGCRYLSCKEV